MAALFYDGLICAALLMTTTLAWIISQPEQTIPPALQLYYQWHLLAVLIGYWLASWYWGGQTIGMRAWQLKLISTTDRLTLWQLLLRCLIAPITLLMGGLGWWWWLHNPDQTLYDQLTRTRIIQITAP